MLSNFRLKLLRLEVNFVLPLSQQEEEEQEQQEQLLGSVQKSCVPFLAPNRPPLPPVIQNDLLMTPPPQKIMRVLNDFFCVNIQIYGNQFDYR